MITRAHDQPRMQENAIVIRGSCKAVFEGLLDEGLREQEEEPLGAAAGDEPGAVGGDWAWECHGEVVGRRTGTFQRELL